MNTTTHTKNLAHHFLLASPYMNDERFEQTLIYVCRHTADGAWGFVINQPLPTSVGGILTELDLPSSQLAMNTPAIAGGPMRPEAGFVLHTGLPNFNSSFAIGENVCLTTSKDILDRLSEDSLAHYLMCMGFCSWGTGQLEAEINTGDWFICPADLQILFRVPFDERLMQAYDKIGINPDNFVTTAGYA
ncbi:YqgE/AlgH family protein [Moraxella haemolytica]|uniref:YqgE/AlgH family protein n=1 Tax=Moraxella haemolytica TaxID=2904119 RepID=UPI002543F8D5|nr:YqgE/AlgH family protein [Moraxella sp. ZY171148]WII95253.1 YqgE/AlgH family protein [Moraxella sp. ZY171148]